MHRFYAPRDSFIADELVTLGQNETRHLRDVLRMRPGSVIHVFDGEGHEFRCELTEITRKHAIARVMNESDPASSESPLTLTLACAILKGEKFDLVVQKCVELGVSRLIPLLTARCDVRLGDRSNKLDRWRKIALEATKQCGRAKLMEIGEPVSLSDIASGPIDGAAILFSERDGSRLTDAMVTGRVTVFVGPEGGWDDAELTAAREGNIAVVTLGGRILRAETAAIAISALLQNRFGDLN